MAVEKMHLVNITSSLKNLRSLLKDVINIGQIEPIDAFNQVASRAFSVKASSENVEITEDINNITSFESLDSDEKNKLVRLKEFFEEMDFAVGKEEDVIDLDELDLIYDKLAPLILKREELTKKRDRLLNNKENLEILNKEGIDLKDLKNLKYFDYRFGDVSKDGRFILKNNYDNIPSLIIHLNNDGKKEEKSSALDEIIKIDNKTKDRRSSTDEIIENEKEESIKVLKDLEVKYKGYVNKSIKEIDEDYYKKIDLKSRSLKETYDKKKNHISDLYDSKLDGLIDDAFYKVIGGEDIARKTREE